MADDDITLLEFKAGKMVLAGTRLQPDTRKGSIRVVRTSDTLMHVHWCPRVDDTLSDAEDDIIVFPDEAKFEKVSQSSQRIYILKFINESDRNVFFWLQEPDAAEDETLCLQMNQMINLPADLDEDMDEDGGDMEEDGGEVALANSTNPGASLTGATSTSVSAGISQDPRALAQLLSLGLQSAMQQQPQGDLATATANSLLARMAAQQQYRQAVRGPSLADLLKPEALALLLQDPDMLPRLAEHLPDGHRDALSLAKLAHSTQFHQQLSSFSAALQTGQLDLQQFGLKAKGFSSADFLEAVQEMVESEAQSAQPGSGSGEGSKPPQ